MKIRDLFHAFQLHHNAIFHADVDTITTFQLNVLVSYGQGNLALDINAA